MDVDEPPPTRDAATVIVVRDAPDGPEVLLLRRHSRSGFAADAWVFPGGVVDEGDRHLGRDRWSGTDPEALTERFGGTADLVLGLHVAAVRETFEEAGLLLAHHEDGTRPDSTAEPYRAARAALGDRDRRFDFAAWLTEERLVLDLADLTYHSRWITPRQEPKRYDTRFFLAAAPEGQVAASDRMETTGQRWLTPQAALAASAAGELLLIYPTIKTLEALATHATLAELRAVAEAQPTIRSIRPHIEKGLDGWRIIHPDEPDYPPEER
jgi:8-oxo-dGTP pyrophosphatase MutT (NUDIX family)